LPIALGFRAVHTASGPYFKPRIDEINERLAAIDHPRKLSLEHFYAVRMYTGPCVTKYHAVLRAGRQSSCDAFSRLFLDSKCRGNTYPTTLLHICAGINILAQLSSAQPCYRAPATGALPRDFWKAVPSRASFDDGLLYHDGAACGLRGGVECLFMRATSSKAEAMRHAAASGSTSLLEIQPGMTARGAELSWLSQLELPSEEEDGITLTFSPLTALDVHHIRIEGAFSVLELRPSTSASATHVHADGFGALTTESLEPRREPRPEPRPEHERGKRGLTAQAATTIQRLTRGNSERTLFIEKKGAAEAEMARVRTVGVVIDGKRVQPWSAETARMAMSERDGKLGGGGRAGRVPMELSLWPKGVVEKLLIERVTYADEIKALAKRVGKHNVKASNVASASGEGGKVDGKEEGGQPPRSLVGRTRMQSLVGRDLLEDIEEVILRKQQARKRWGTLKQRRNLLLAMSLKATARLKEAKEAYRLRSVCLLANFP